MGTRQVLGIIYKGKIPIEVRGEPGTNARLVDLYLTEGYYAGEYLGRVGVCGQATPEQWSVYQGRGNFDPVALAAQANALVGGE